MWSLIKTVLLSTLASATLRCPDGSSCPEESSCCKLGAGGYGCCPVGEDGFSTLSKTQAPEMKSGAESSRVSSNSSAVKCDQMYSCPDYYVCCKTVTGHWTCCRHPSTVCCYRGTKCCPADNTQDITPSSAALEDRTDPVEGESLPEMETQNNDISTGPATGDQDGFSTLSKTQAPEMKSGAESSRVSSNSSAVKCDQMYSCPDYYVCCKTVTGHWTCCRHPSTVCCFRGTKCCPADNTQDITPSSAALEDRTDPVEGESLPEMETQNNDISTGPATGDQDGFSTLSKTQAPEMKSGAESSRVSSNSSAVKCDQMYSCPDYYVCCKTVTGHWTCCRHPSTVCCYRGTKCCPADNTHDITPSSAALEDRTDPVEGESLPEMETQNNDISTGPATGDQDGFSTLSKTQAPEMKSGAESSRVSSNSSAVKCDQMYSCPDYYVCCKTVTGHWTCCRHPSTVCCYRGTKCCPADNTHDITPSSAALEDRTDPVEGESLPEMETQNNDISTGPATGDQDGFSTLSKTQAPEMKSGAESSRVSSNSSAVKCDQMYSCPDYYVCCKTVTGHWTCCRHPSTVCCYRGTKCCPADNTHDITPSSAALEDRTDPVEGESLPEMETQNNDISTGPATGDQDGFSTLSKTQAPEMKSGAESSRVSSNSSAVKCDQMYSCPDYYVCCKTVTGHWTCCRHPSTVCCYRGTKCCPADNTHDITPSSAALEDRTDPVEGESLPEMETQNNDISTGPATGDQDGFSTLSKTQAPEMKSGAESSRVSSNSSAVKCDQMYSCPDYYVCCKTVTGHWTCCRHPSTVCCYRGTKCCPADNTHDITPSSAALEDRTDPVEGESLPEMETQNNDISTGPATGDQDGFSTLSKTQAPEMKSGAESSRVSSNSSAVKCDQMYSCPDYYVCCKTVTGHWTCCRHPSTVCCYRGTKCCPADNTHDITPSSAALEDRTDPVEGESLPEMETQNNDISTGPATGDQAKCCKDGGNCCPPGTKCDPQSSLCRMDDVSFPWSIKKLALRKSEVQQNCKGSDCTVIQCDDTHVCKAGSCCKLSNHQWGCCPYPDAHCCWDGKHCCPRYHWCDTKRNLCKRWWPPYEWKQISSIKYNKESENL
ncbi:uncharacterized protein [Hemitrygon akajei]|uniref:uncharacterized protein isoform X2 n=1 Tax=Hemitrygon akajei TaxID=2704970 RepID=UPI003BF9FAA1